MGGSCPVSKVFAVRCAGTSERPHRTGASGGRNFSYMHYRAVPVRTYDIMTIYFSFFAIGRAYFKFISALSICQLPAVQFCYVESGGADVLADCHFYVTVAFIPKI